MGKDFGEFSIDRGPGLSVVAAPVDGLALTGIVNKGGLASGAEGKLAKAGEGYGFLAKGEYAADLFTVGAGYQSERGKLPDPLNVGKYIYNKDASNRTALAVYGSMNVMDDLTIKAEYGNRVQGTKKDDKAITAILAGAKYDDSVLVVDGSYLMADQGFKIQSDDDASEWLARDIVKSGSWEASVVFVDASYALNDALNVPLKVLGSFDYILNAKADDVEIKFEDGNDMSYKAGLEYQFTDALKAEGWYKGFGKFVDDKAHSQFGGKATYTFAKGVDGIFELTNGRGASDSEAYTRYKAVLSATF